MSHKHYIRNALALQTAVLIYAYIHHALTWLVLLMAATMWICLLLSWLLDTTPPKKHRRERDATELGAVRTHRSGTSAVPDRN
jgi:hypothetical protein